MYISLYKLKPKPFSTTRSLFSFDRKKLTLSVLQNSRKYLKINDLKKILPYFDLRIVSI